MSAKKYPRFVWSEILNQDNVCHPEICYTEQFRSERGADGKGIQSATVAQHDLFEGEEQLSLEELARRYPPPVGWTCRHLPNANVQLTQDLQVAEPEPISVGQKPTE